MSNPAPRAPYPPGYVPVTLTKVGTPVPDIAARFSAFLDFPCTVLRYEEGATYTVEANGTTYTGCTLEKLDEDRTRVWLVGRPNPVATPTSVHPNAPGRSAPRRNCVDLFTSAEKAIHDAMYVVEGAGADVRLTDAINLLSAAKDAVSDYVDGIPFRRTVQVRAG